MDKTYSGLCIGGLLMLLSANYAGSSKKHQTREGAE